MDREKVIKALECCEKTDGSDCKNCPYTDECDCVEFMSRDALAMLKEQEAVEPVKQVEQTEWTVCGNCRNHLVSKWIFCPNCGRSVKWE